MVESQVISQQVELMRGLERPCLSRMMDVQQKSRQHVAFVMFNLTPKKKKQKHKRRLETAGAALHKFEKSSYQNLKIPVVLPNTNTYIKDTKQESRCFGVYLGSRQPNLVTFSL